LRKAFRWTYEQLELEKSRRSILIQSKKSGSLRKPIRQAFQKLDALSRFDQMAFHGSPIILGVDEVGRGPLAGPLVAVCVQLPSPLSLSLPFLRDSKKLSGSEREHLAEVLKKKVIQAGYGIVEASEFGGALNLHRLTFLAMERALKALKLDPDKPYALLTDGKFELPAWKADQKAVIKGDDTSLSIAAASVLAKVHRDRIMMELDRKYPAYGFAKHVGYGTTQHREALLACGPCPQHRMNFLSKILAGGDTGSPR
jgi:ribonuclease HII